MILTRYFVKVIFLVLGLFIMALGISVSVKANLGVSPISCVPYIYSLKTPFTMGELTILMNALFMVMQIAILRKKYSIIQLIQLPAVIILGYSIDFTFYLASAINPGSYIGQIFWLLVSCLLIAFGIFLLVKADLTYIPGDGLVVVISETFKKDFGKMKMCFDSTMLFIGVTSSFVLIGKLAGIREGTFIAALLVGTLIRIYNRLFSKFCSPLATFLEPKEIKAVAARANGYFPVITISREYGSGGHEIGKLIAKELGISFYDKELIALTAEQSGFTEAYIKDNEQKITNSLLHEIYSQNYAYVKDKLPSTDVLFLIQSKIIRDICNKESCVIVGRCANFVLKDNPESFNLFIHANNEYRIDKIINDYKLSSSFSEKDLEQADHDRANYCLHYTDQNWKDATNYHVTMDSSIYTTKQAAEKLIELFHASEKLRVGP